MIRRWSGVRLTGDLDAGSVPLLVRAPEIITTPLEGVIDTDHQVFGYPGLYVCDGSAISANLGVNPSLTITAMTELAMSKIPNKM